MEPDLFSKEEVEDFVQRYEDIEKESESGNFPSHKSCPKAQRTDRYQRKRTDNQRIPSREKSEPSSCSQSYILRDSTVVLVWVIFGKNSIC